MHIIKVSESIYIYIYSPPHPLTLKGTRRSAEARSANLSETSWALDADLAQGLEKALPPKPHHQL